MGEIDDAINYCITVLGDRVTDCTSAKDTKSTEAELAFLIDSSLALTQELGRLK